MHTGLEGRVVIITGAASGIGRAAALAFAAEGASLALVDRGADQGGEARARREIGAGARRAHPERRNLLASAGELLGTPGAQCDVRSLRRERERGGASDSGPGTGDGGDAALEGEVHAVDHDSPDPMASCIRRSRRSGAPVLACGR